jgi:predicted transcriptional regulator
MDLAELRHALELSQEQLAKKLHVNQPEVAKIEKRADMLLSTLTAVLRAMGADLKLVASFPPDHEIQLRNLGTLAKSPTDKIQLKHVATEDASPIAAHVRRSRTLA